jgi:TRAP-type C4-dicarboxylate transport system substrate-binding protein
MYKRYLLLGVVLVTVVLGFAAIGAAKSITLTFANQNPDTSWSGMHAIGPWAKQVEKTTNGKVKVQIFYSQTLTKGKDAWEATKSGIADIAWCFHGYWSGMTPPCRCGQFTGPAIQDG